MPEKIEYVELKVFTRLGQNVNTGKKVIRIRRNCRGNWSEEGRLEKGKEEREVSVVYGVEWVELVVQNSRVGLILFKDQLGEN